MSVAGTVPHAAAPEPNPAAAPAPSLLAAIAAVRSEIGPLPKDKTNPHFGSSFTGLETLTQRAMPVLERHGIAWFTKPSSDEHGRPVLKYRLQHLASGEVESDQMPLIGVEHMQGFGSALTYARRYALVTALNLIADDDDDGAASVAQARRNRGESERPTHDLTALARGLSDEGLNAALTHAGLQPVEKPWRIFMRVPGEYVDAIREGLEAAHAAEGR